MRTIDTGLRGDQVRGLLRKFEHLIVGQNEAIDKITNLLERFLGGMSDNQRPIGSALFLGPTGVGKTAVVEAMCEGLYGDRNHMIKIDCAEFQFGHEIAKLIGSPPGYLGHKETPARLKQETVTKLYTQDVPFAVILFDEIEKASDEVWQLLLGVLDRGNLTLGDNSKTDFTKCIIILTSNCGAREIMEGKVGFNRPDAEDVSQDEISDSSMSAARAKFTPEFLNRLDEVCVFNTLDRASIEKIMHMEAYKCKAKLMVKGGVKLEISPAAFNELLDRGFDKKYNARGIRRTLEKEIMTPLARAISSFEVAWGDFLVMDYRDAKFSFYSMKQKVGTDGVLRDNAQSNLPAGQLPLPPV